MKVIHFMSITLAIFLISLTISKPILVFDDIEQFKNYLMDSPSPSNLSGQLPIDEGSFQSNRKLESFPHQIENKNQLVNLAIVCFKSLSSHRFVSTVNDEQNPTDLVFLGSDECKMSSWFVIQKSKQNENAFIIKDYETSLGLFPLTTVNKKNKVRIHVILSGDEEEVELWEIDQAENYNGTPTFSIKNVSSGKLWYSHGCLKKSNLSLILEDEKKDQVKEKFEIHFVGICDGECAGFQEIYVEGETRSYDNSNVSGEDNDISPEDQSTSSHFKTIVSTDDGVDKENQKSQKTSVENAEKKSEETESNNLDDKSIQPGESTFDQNDSIEEQPSTQSIEESTKQNQPKNDSIVPQEPEAQVVGQESNPMQDLDSTSEPAHFIDDFHSINQGRNYCMLTKELLESSDLKSLQKDCSNGLIIQFLNVARSQKSMTTEILRVDKDKILNARDTSRKSEYVSLVDRSIHTTGQQWVLSFYRDVDDGLKWVRINHVETEYFLSLRFNSHKMFIFQIFMDDLVSDDNLFAFVPMMKDE